MDTYPYVSILLEYHKSIWWLPQAGRGPWPTAIKIALFVRTTRNLRNPLKDWKFYVALFLLASKKTHTSMIILWKAKSSCSIRVLAFSRWPSLQYSCFALILFSIDFCGQAISSRKSTSCAFFRVFDSLVYFPGNEPILSSYQLQEIYDLGFTFRGDFWPIKKISISIVKTSERTFLIWHSNPISCSVFCRIFARGKNDDGPCDDDKWRMGGTKTPRDRRRGLLYIRWQYVISLLLVVLSEITFHYSEHIAPPK